MDKTIEIPNNKREIIKYITDTCRINNINDCKTNCTTNLECLSNKCFNNKCIFNNENPIVHCDDIYDSNKISSYMYCGKAYLDTCNNNDECSSKSCDENYCLKQLLGPSYIYLIILFFFNSLIFLILI